MVYAETKLFLCAVLTGTALDLLLGDPHCFYHPVRLIGSLISFLERNLRKIFPAGKGGERAAGLFLAIFTTTMTFMTVYFLLAAACRWNRIAYFILASLLSYWLLAARSLWDESMLVCRKLRGADPEGARKAVSMIVGRDTEKLDEAGIARAAVETVAENCSDGVIAPMLYLILLGPAAGWAYKAVNTMDSMVGYRNERYRYFGTAAARLDDILNFIPSRLSAILMIPAAFLLRMDWRGAYRIWRRDRFRHASPNSAQTESAMAGALGLKLAGDAWYFGRLVKKETIGDDTRPVCAEDIERADRLMMMTSLLGLVLMILVRYVLSCCILPAFL